MEYTAGHAKLSRCAFGAMLALATACATAHAAPLSTGPSFVAVKERPGLAFTPKSVRVAAETNSAPASATAEYTVQAGDTLWRISQRFGMSVTELRSVNQLDTSTSIKVGQTLRVQKEGPSPKTQAALASLKAHAAAPEPDAQPAMTGLQTRPATAAPAPTQPSASAAAPGKKYPLVWPVEGVLTSRFGTRDGRAHDGIDIGAAPGSKVKAAADGDVIFADNHRSYGNLVLIRHASNLVTVYAHNAQNLVNKGQRVKAGQPIALVGSTGHSTGPHVHFEVRRGVVAENPLALLPP